MENDIVIRIMISKECVIFQIKSVKKIIFLLSKINKIRVFQELVIFMNILKKY